MEISDHQYTPSDFERVGEFLIANYQPENQDGNWFQPTWEYMHSHPLLDEDSLHRIRLWETSGSIVAVVHFEWHLGEAFFQIHPDYSFLKPEMLDYAENHLLGESESGERYLRVFVNDFDQEFEDEVKSRGYGLIEPYARPISVFPIPQPFPPVQLPNGFRLKSLAEDNDLHKINRVLWRGFNHPGEPPEEEIPGRLKMQSVPNFRKELKIVVEEPGGNFVSFCGMWYEPGNKIAYVEPVATDPDYRRIGLGKAAVLEGVRRCGEEGAMVAYVGSDLDFYLAIGFSKLYDSRCWVKHFPVR